MLTNAQRKLQLLQRYVPTYLLQLYIPARIHATCFPPLRPTATSCVDISPRDSCKIVDQYLPTRAMIWGVVCDLIRLVGYCSIVDALACHYLGSGRLFVRYRDNMMDVIIYEALVCLSVIGTTTDGCRMLLFRDRSFTCPISLQQMDAERLDYPDNTFHTVRSVIIHTKTHTHTSPETHKSGSLLNPN
eukprot:1376381-Amorphochlora_amoeboformis.AAC.2